MSSRLRLPALTAALLLAVTLTSCGSNADQPTQAAQSPLPPTSAADQVAGNAAKTQAAELRAELTALLREDVNLTAFAAYTAVASGYDSEATQAAIETMHHSAHAITQLVATVHPRQDPQHTGSEMERLSSHWKDYVEYIADYIEGAVSSDESAKTEALGKIHELEEELALVLADVTQDVVSVADAHGLLGAHTGLLTTTIDTIADKDPGSAESVLHTAKAAQEMAEELSRGLALRPGEVTGDPLSEAAELRAHLTGYLVQHIGQTFVMAHLVATAGADSERAATAIETMHTNMERIADEIGTFYDKATAEEFTRLYERHIKELVAYAEAAATETGTETTTPSPTDFPKEFADFADRMTEGKLHEHEFELAISEQMDAVKAGIETIAKSSVSAASEVEHVQAEALLPAELLTVAIVEQFPEEITG